MLFVGGHAPGPELKIPKRRTSKLAPTLFNHSYWGKILRGLIENDEQTIHLTGSFDVREMTRAQQSELSDRLLELTKNTKLINVQLGVLESTVELLILLIQCLHKRNAQEKVVPTEIHIQSETETQTLNYEKLFCTSDNFVADKLALGTIINSLNPKVERKDKAKERNQKTFWYSYDPTQPANNKRKRLPNFVLVSASYPKTKKQM